jgi:hypothetical protein
MTERPSTGRGPGTVVTYALYAVCAALIVAELVIDRETEFNVEGWFGFYAVFGFAAYCGIVNAAKVLRRIVRRPEDYYLPDDEQESPSLSTGRRGETSAQ